MNWRIIPLPGRRVLSDWIAASRAEVVSSRGCFCVVPQAGLDALGKVMTPNELAEIFAKSKILRRSVQSYRIVTSALCTVNEKPFFMKKIEGRRIEYSTQNLFRYGRTLNASVAAGLLKRAGIHTPGTLLVSEQRKGVILESEYMITEIMDETLYTFYEFLNDSEDPMGAIESIIPSIAELAARMHCAGVFHRDFHLANIFCSRDNPLTHYGVFDLLDAKAFPHSVPDPLWMNEFFETFKVFNRFGRRCNVSIEYLYPLFLDEYASQVRSISGRKIQYLPLLDALKERVRTHTD